MFDDKRFLSNNILFVAFAIEILVELYDSGHVWQLGN